MQPPSTKQITPTPYPTPTSFNMGDFSFNFSSSAIGPVIPDEEKEISDAEKQITDAEKQITDAEKQISDAEKQIAACYSHNVTNHTPVTPVGKPGRGVPVIPQYNDFIPDGSSDWDDILDSEVSKCQAHGHPLDDFQYPPGFNGSGLLLQNGSGLFDDPAEFQSYLPWKLHGDNQSQLHPVANVANLQSGCASTSSSSFTQDLATGHAVYGTAYPAVDALEVNPAAGYYLDSVDANNSTMNAGSRKESEFGNTNGLGGITIGFENDRREGSLPFQSFAGYNGDTMDSQASCHTQDFWAPLIPTSVALSDAHLGAIPILVQPRPESSTATASVPSTTHSAHPTLLQNPTNGRFLCGQPGCSASFKRLADRARHIRHRHNRTPYFCPIPGCAKSHGNGFSRPDKVTEHLWRVHANLGFTKSS